MIDKDLPSASPRGRTNLEPQESIFSTLRKMRQAVVLAIGTLLGGEQTAMAFQEFDPFEGISPEELPTDQSLTPELDVDTLMRSSGMIASEEERALKEAAEDAITRTSDQTQEQIERIVNSFSKEELDALLQILLSKGKPDSESDWIPFNEDPLINRETLAKYQAELQRALQIGDVQGLSQEAQELATDMLQALKEAKETVRQTGETGQEQIDLDGQLDAEVIVKAREVLGRIPPDLENLSEEEIAEIESAMNDAQAKLEKALSGAISKLGIKFDKPSKSWWKPDLPWQADLVVGALKFVAWLILPIALLLLAIKGIRAVWNRRQNPPPTSGGSWGNSPQP